MTDIEQLMRAMEAEIKRLRDVLCPPDGFDFTISLDRGKWTYAIWEIGKPGGGIHTHGQGDTFNEARVNAEIRLTEMQRKIAGRSALKDEQ